MICMHAYHMQLTHIRSRNFFEGVIDSVFSEFGGDLFPVLPVIDAQALVRRYTMTTILSHPAQSLICGCVFRPPSNSTRFGSNCQFRGQCHVNEVGSNTTYAERVRCQ